MYVCVCVCVCVCVKTNDKHQTALSLWPDVKGTQKIKWILNGYESVNDGLCKPSCKRHIISNVNNFYSAAELTHYGEWRSVWRW